MRVAIKELLKLDRYPVNKFSFFEEDIETIIGFDKTRVNGYYPTWVDLTELSDEQQKTISVYKYMYYDINNKIITEDCDVDEHFNVAEYVDGKTYSGIYLIEVINVLGIPTCIHILDMSFKTIQILKVSEENINLLKDILLESCQTFVYDDYIENVCETITTDSIPDSTPSIIINVFNDKDVSSDIKQALNYKDGIPDMMEEIVFHLGNFSLSQTGNDTQRHTRTLNILKSLLSNNSLELRSYDDYDEDYSILDYGESANWYLFYNDNPIMKFTLEDGYLIQIENIKIISGVEPVIKDIRSRIILATYGESNHDIVDLDYEIEFDDTDKTSYSIRDNKLVLTLKEDD